MDWRKIRARRNEGAPVDGTLNDARSLAERRRDREREARPSLLRDRGVPIGLGAVFIIGTAAGLFADGGFVELSRLRGQRAELREDLAQRRHRVGALEGRIERLQNDPATLERIAREQLGYARPGELVFLLPRESDDVLVEPLEAP